MQRDLHIKWFYPYPVETIWQCLTDPELLKQWSLNAGDFKAEVGFKWMMVQPPRPKMKWDGKTYFEVLEIVPLQKLAYSLQGGPAEGVITLDTVVTWKLYPQNGGTELHLHHTGFKGPRNIFTSFIMEMGWKKKVIKRLEKAMQQFIHGQEQNNR